MQTKIITVREFRENQASYFDLAETQRVVIKRGKKLITLSVGENLIENKEDWFKGFFAIPEQYRCNPYEISPSGDLFYADKRNIEVINKGIEEAKAGKTVKLTKDEQKELLKIR